MKNKQEEFTKKEEDSIIDISGLNYKIPTKDNFTSTTMSSNKSNNNLINPKNGVPKWEFRYIYFYGEITQATPRQKEFYSFFRENFLKNRYVDVKGNINYLSVLVHDLMRSYTGYKDIAGLEAHFQRLAENYPDIKDHVNNIIKRLHEKEEERIKREEQSRLAAERMRNFTDNYFNNYTYIDRRLGAFYKDKLNLNKEEVELLNNMGYYSNPFFSIEFISLEVIKLFLATIKALKEKFKKEKTTFESVWEEVCIVIIKKHFNFRTGSRNYQMQMSNMDSLLYPIIFKLTEIAIRKQYNYKKKLSVSSFVSTAQNTLQLKLLSPIQTLLSELVLDIKPLDEETDKKLFDTDTHRWKIKYEELKTELEKKNISAEEFLKEFVALSLLNENNVVSHRNMFFDVAKYMAFQDKEVAVSLYIYYLFYDMGVEAKTKTLTKKAEKELFQNKEQETKFEEIKNQLLKDVKLKAALEKVPSIYYVERKKITLDISSIKEVQQLHSETVEILNEYLKDEKEEIKPKKEIKEKAKKEIKTEIQKIKNSTKKAETKTESTTNYLSELQLSDSQKMVLDYFAKNKFSISKQDFEKLATQNGTFKNQLLESLNEKCYEILDDVLIEEEENYTIYETYYKKLIV